MADDRRSSLRRAGPPGQRPPGAARAVGGPTGFGPPAENAATGRAGDRLDAVTFAQVGGMAEVKRIIEGMVVQPRRRPAVQGRPEGRHEGRHETRPEGRHTRRAGGGILLYGPPGCGKTLLAQATAGEFGLPFVDVRIEDVIDPYLGVSERNLHEAVVTARAQAPCVLFLDELDALASTRPDHHDAGAGTTLGPGAAADHGSGGTGSGRGAGGRLDALVRALDAARSGGRDIVVLAATNTPWHVNEAVLRPGRIDRMVFVHPPDLAARQRIVERVLAAVPTQGVDGRRLAERTPLFSGADLRAVVERAVDRVFAADPRHGAEPVLRMEHLEWAASTMRPTTLDWLHRAQGYVEVTHQTDRYAALAAYLRSREFRRRVSTPGPS